MLDQTLEDDVAVQDECSGCSIRVANMDFPKPKRAVDLMPYPVLNAAVFLGEVRRRGTSLFPTVREADRKRLRYHPV